MGSQAKISTMGSQAKISTMESQAEISNYVPPPLLEGVGRHFVFGVNHGVTG